ncbi:hypothetical protein KUV57_11950 [Epibacterium sp. DP7N7-1]|nr:hypothetical protein [Epibacterium sp. DP7N7-1]
MSFETMMQKAQAQVDAANTKVTEISAVMADAGNESALDIENATLEEVHSHTDVMNGNIADLIMGLDDVTQKFQGEFDAMRSKTLSEKFVGIFARGKSESMRAERIREASIDDKLQDLIGKSGTIVAMLDGQLAILQDQKGKVETNLAATLTKRETVVDQLESTRVEMGKIDPIIIELENKISVETGAGARSKLESELAAKNQQYNELVRSEQVYLAESQTLERYVEKGKTWVDSLENQIATQMVLISKLKTDTQQRVVLYDALSKSLKTAQQQDVAHRINDIGVKTDQEAQVAMAGIGAATNARIADMLESHEDHMVFARDVQEKKRKADERFMRRFQNIVDKHDANAYGAQ